LAGTVIVNPGGPGGSGTDFVRTDGDKIAVVIGPEFDILGFDPRGTGATTPLALCFESDSQFDVWNLQDVPSLNINDGSIPFAKARDRVVGQRCLGALGGNGSQDPHGTTGEWGPGRFMDTASVATDMLRIVEKLGQDRLQYAGLVRSVPYMSKMNTNCFFHRVLALSLVNILLQCTPRKSAA
jgi:pimeloyl-ACP methyl ester carboxylesterase